VLLLVLQSSSPQWVFMFCKAFTTPFYSKDFMLLWWLNSTVFLWSKKGQMNGQVRHKAASKNSHVSGLLVCLTLPLIQPFVDPTFGFTSHWLVLNKAVPIHPCPDISNDSGQWVVSHFAPKMERVRTLKCHQIS